MLEAAALTYGQIGAIICGAIAVVGLSVIIIKYVTREKRRHNKETKSDSFIDKNKQ